MTHHTHLVEQLQQLDGKGYKAYKVIRGSYDFPRFTLKIDRVQGDPFAKPSQCRVLIPQKIAGFPAALYANHSRAVGLRDFLTRQFHQLAQQRQRRSGTGNSGLIAITQPGPEILERTAAFIDDEQVELRFWVGLPARGRRIDGWQAADLLCEQIPQLVEGLLYAQLPIQHLQHHIDTQEDADWLRQQLSTQGLVAFVADGAILPRRSGIDRRPLDTATPFQSPASLRVEFHCPHQGVITGMGIPAGITLIVGGGYHGKSTLLKALELGIYNHIPGDGRELVVTNGDAVKIRAEEGRPVAGVDLSPFINHLPHQQNTTQFYTANASGSTSQAANIIEALELDAQVLLIDEDTTATNLMIRDRRMQSLIAKDQEPITPFIDQIRPLYEDRGVSSILVMGGSGDYFEVADTVIALTAYRPENVTEQAHGIAAQYPSDRTCEAGQPINTHQPRILRLKPSALEWKGRPAKVKVHELREIILGREAIDLSYVEQLVESGQLRAIAAAILYLHQSPPPDLIFSHGIRAILSHLAAEGLSALSSFPEGDFVAFRRFELAAALNRWRNLDLEN
ncbi:ABC-ATPase domain-containing protein [Acaryochloris sp. CCMEE 5410]|uniref:ABC-ATPase domain-containing protein n=1 Tax=Acaryochloris sp. CCMEE 5410 TaxID=310037 RepID=UPI00024846C1|nr:ABC-ATPase domain-containing protein [Acaryochloris sp. CCMEE 5410]KAI9135153.1 ABC-ATPase domain-containing protein [Acaryochloris sp. CCMEE 5410]